MVATWGSASCHASTLHGAFKVFICVAHTNWKGRVTERGRVEGWVEWTVAELRLIWQSSWLKISILKGGKRIPYLPPAPRSFHSSFPLFPISTCRVLFYFYMSYFYVSYSFHPFLFLYVLFLMLCVVTFGTFPSKRTIYTYMCAYTWLHPYPPTSCIYSCMYIPWCIHTNIHMQTHTNAQSSSLKMPTCWLMCVPTVFVEGVVHKQNSFRIPCLCVTKTLQHAV